MSRTTSKRYPGIFSYSTKRDGKLWGARVEGDRDWRTGQRVQICERRFATQEAAREWQRAFQERRRRGEVTTQDMTPLGAYLTDWLAKRTGIAESTRWNYELRIRRLLPHIGAIPLARLAPRDIERCYGALLADGLEGSTVHAIHQLLRQAIRDAVRLRMIGRDPMDGVKPPSHKSKPRTILTVEQMKILLESTAGEEPWGLIWRVLAETWMRVGELIDLRWAAVDCSRQEIRVERTVSRIVTGTVSAPGKTAAARRTLPISPYLADWLQRYRDAATYSETWTTETLVFCTMPDTWMSAAGVGTALAAACARAGVPRISPHEIRHSGASHAHDANVPPVTMQMRLGHADVSTTLRTYSHPAAAEHRKLSTLISDLYD